MASDASFIKNALQQFIEKNMTQEQWELNSQYL